MYDNVSLSLVPLTSEELTAPFIHEFYTYMLQNLEETDTITYLDGGANDNIKSRIKKARAVSLNL